MKRLLPFLKSKTVWGGVLVAVGGLLQAPVIGQAEIVQAIGVVLGAIGIRDSVSRAAREVLTTPVK